MDLVGDHLATPHANYERLILPGKPLRNDRIDLALEDEKFHLSIRSRNLDTHRHMELMTVEMSEEAHLVDGTVRPVMQPRMG